MEDWRRVKNVHSEHRADWREEAHRLAADGIEVRKIHERIIVEFRPVAVCACADYLLAQFRLDVLVLHQQV